MCGIVGYVGFRPAAGIVLEGLRRLEYRGYDSAGLAVPEPGGALRVEKAAGRLERLEGLVRSRRPAATTGIGHTRWATHGSPTDRNAHPHLGGAGSVAVVHNGVVENYRSLKSLLEAEGYVFRSETDSEVIAHLIDSCLQRAITNTVSRPEEAGADATAADLPEITAVREAVGRLRGTYGLLVLFAGRPDLLVAARLGSPLVVGVGDGEHVVASDASPLAGRTDRIVYLADREIAAVTAGGLAVLHRDEGPVRHDIHALDLQVCDVAKGDFPHFMLKEIHEQPETVAAAMRGRICRDDATSVFGGLNLTPKQLQRVRRVVLTGCGTSWHAALVGEYLIEAFARLPVEVEYASELRYRNPPLDDGTLLFAITQSGETADTLNALRYCKSRGALTMGITNTVGSTISRETHCGVHINAGPEIGVASTKAYTSQILSLTMFALVMSADRLSLQPRRSEIIQALKKLPDQVCPRSSVRYKSHRDCWLVECSMFWCSGHWACCDKALLFYGTHCNRFFVPNSKILCYYLDNLPIGIFIGQRSI